MPMPFVIGRDFCGEIIEVGRNVRHFKIGERVWSNCQGIQNQQGTFAQFLAVNPATIFPLPSDVDPIAAVGAFHSAFTAILGLTREAELKVDDVLFVHGGAGSEALLPIGDLYTKDASIRGFAITNASLTETQQAALQINQLLAQHAIKTKIAQKLPLSEAREAHRLMEKDEIWGKIILEIP